MFFRRLFLTDPIRFMGVFSAIFAMIASMFFCFGVPAAMILEEMAPFYSKIIVVIGITLCAEAGILGWCTICQWYQTETQEAKAKELPKTFNEWHPSL